METHAYVTPHVDLNDAPTRNTINLDVISAYENTTISPSCNQLATEYRDEQGITNQNTFSDNSNDLETIRPMSNVTDFSAITNADIHRAAQFIYGSDVSANYFNRQMDRVKGKFDSKDMISADGKNSMEALLTPAYQYPDFEIHVHSDVNNSHSFDHLYEEIGVDKDSRNAKYDILDYYEKYSPTTAKTLIDTLFLPRHRICKQCAILQISPVYSDRLIYFKKPLYAKEAILIQFEDSLHFKYNKQSNSLNNRELLYRHRNESYMPISNLIKTNASGILYSNFESQDVFDLKSTLEPTILLVNDTFSGIANTQLFHRNTNNYYRRISKTGFAPMIFEINQDNILHSIKSVGYEADLHNWMNYRNDIVKLRNSKQNELPLSIIEPHPNRSSLLLLEPLLLMPDLTSSRQEHMKSRISHAEHKKIVRMLIAYTLAFFLLAIITFYIVYFT